MEILTYEGEGFQVLKESNDWKIGFLRYSKRFAACKEMERHLETDEAFILLTGKAALLTDVVYPMKEQVLYVVPKGVWHHIVVSKDAVVMVVENRNTSKENTEKKTWDRELWTDELKDTLCED